MLLVIVLTQRKALAYLLRRPEEVVFPGIVGLKLREKSIEIAQETVKVDPNAGKAPTDKQIEAAGKVEKLVRDVELSVLRRQAFELAREYDNIRAVLPADDERTHKMEVIITKMRLFGFAALPLLPELASSFSHVIFFNDSSKE